MVIFLLFYFYYKRNQSAYSSIPPSSSRTLSTGMTNSMRNLLAIGVRQPRCPLSSLHVSVTFIFSSTTSVCRRPRTLHRTGTQRVCLDLNSGKPLHRCCRPLTDLSLAQATDTFCLLALIPTCLAPHYLPAVGHTRVLIPTRKRELWFAQSEDTQTNAGSAWNQKPVSLQGQCPSSM